MTRKDPLIVFVHIPKTAGSTVNAVLNKHFDHGFMQCEGIIDNLPSLTRVACLLYTSPSPRDLSTSRMPSSA